MAHTDEHMSEADETARPDSAGAHTSIKPEGSPSVQRDAPALTPTLAGPHVRCEVPAGCAGWTLERLLRDGLGVSGRMLQRLTRARKGLSVNGRKGHLGRALRAGDTVAFLANGGERASAPQGGRPPEPPIAPLWSDPWWSVVNKPAGLLLYPTQPRHADQPALLAGQPRGVRLVHRLDRPTSGALVLAHNAYAHHVADGLIRARDLKRHYLAWVRGAVSDASGSIDAPIGRGAGGSREVRADGDHAVTHFTRLSVGEDAQGAVSLLEVRLETGRTHQIRVHLAHLGHSIAGDARYGGRAERGGGDLGRLGLHAHEVAWRHPFSGAPVRVAAPLPAPLERWSQERGIFFEPKPHAET